MISVLIATRDRAPVLARTLEALTRLTPPAGGWRLIVVDNGSRDATPNVLAAYRERLPLTVLREAVPGKNAAVNAALPAVCDGLVVFLDDDVVPEREWLVHYRAVAQAQPDFAVFGGVIRPLWESQPPRWIREWVDLSLCFGVHPEMAEGPCSPDLVFGGNMALRSEVFRQGHRFDRRFGPSGARCYPLGGETEFLHRVRAAGFRSFHSRAAAAGHFVPAGHLTRGFVLIRARNSGRAQYLLDGPAWRSLKRGSYEDTAARLRWAIREQRWRAWTAALGARPAERFRACWQMNLLAGLALEHGAVMHANRRQFKEHGAGHDNRRRDAEASGSRARRVFAMRRSPPRDCAKS